jgi:SAM-dependent methyltransferase
VKQVNPGARTIAIEAGKVSAEILRGKVDEVYVLDIERNELPVLPGTIDLIIANQVLEHTKEIFWIFDQVTRALKTGGHFIIGVPNVVSFHNRLLSVYGRHPTQHKLCSAHVRPFSKKDTVQFLESCFPAGYRLVDFGGAQFYPLPGRLARATANLFPTMAMSIFFLIQKQREYSGEFAGYPARAQFETNFWAGEENAGASQY